LYAGDYPRHYVVGDSRIGIITNVYGLTRASSSGLTSNVIELIVQELVIAGKTLSTTQIDTIAGKILNNTVFYGQSIYIEPKTRNARNGIDVGSVDRYSA
jgi:hypothetical protein